MVTIGRFVSRAWETCPKNDPIQGVTPSVGAGRLVSPWDVSGWMNSWAPAVRITPTRAPAWTNLDASSAVASAAIHLETADPLGIESISLTVWPLSGKRAARPAADKRDHR